MIFLYSPIAIKLPQNLANNSEPIPEFKFTFAVKSVSNIDIIYGNDVQF